MIDKEELLNVLDYLYECGGHINYKDLMDEFYFSKTHASELLDTLLEYDIVGLDSYDNIICNRDYEIAYDLVNYYFK